MRILPRWVKVPLAVYLAFVAITGTAEAAYHLTYESPPTKGMNFLPEITGIRTQAPPVYEPVRATGRAVGRPVTIVEPTSSKWDCIAKHESGHRWDYNGSSGYDGGLQFSPSTWRAAGGERYAPYAYQASREEQIAVAESWLAKTNWGQWPNTSRMCGYR